MGKDTEYYKDLAKENVKVMSDILHNNLICTDEIIDDLVIDSRFVEEYYSGSEKEALHRIIQTHVNCYGIRTPIFGKIAISTVNFLSISNGIWDIFESYIPFYDADNVRTSITTIEEDDIIYYKDRLLLSSDKYIIAFILDCIKMKKMDILKCTFNILLNDKFEKDITELTSYVNELDSILLSIFELSDNSNKINYFKDAYKHFLEDNEYMPTKNELEQRDDMLKRMHDFLDKDKKDITVSDIYDVLKFTKYILSNSLQLGYYYMSNSAVHLTKIFTKAYNYLNDNSISHSVTMTGFKEIILNIIIDEIMFTEIRHTEGLSELLYLNNRVTLMISHFYRAILMISTRGKKDYDLSDIYNLALDYYDANPNISFLKDTSNVLKLERSSAWKYLGGIMSYILYWYTRDKRLFNIFMEEYTKDITVISYNGFESTRSDAMLVGYDTCMKNIFEFEMPTYISGFENKDEYVIQNDSESIIKTLTIAKLIYLLYRYDGLDTGTLFNFINVKFDEVKYSIKLYSNLIAMYCNTVPYENKNTCVLTAFLEEIVILLTTTSDFRSDILTEIVRKVNNVNYKDQLLKIMISLYKSNKKYVSEFSITDNIIHLLSYYNDEKYMDDAIGLAEKFAITFRDSIQYRIANEVPLEYDIEYHFNLIKKYYNAYCTVSKNVLLDYKNFASKEEYDRIKNIFTDIALMNVINSCAIKINILYSKCIFDDSIISDKLTKYIPRSRFNVIDKDLKEEIESFMKKLRYDLNSIGTLSSIDLAYALRSVTNSHTVRESYRENKMVQTVNGKYMIGGMYSKLVVNSKDIVENDITLDNNRLRITNTYIHAIKILNDPRKASVIMKDIAIEVFRYYFKRPKSTICPFKSQKFNLAMAQTMSSLDILDVIVTVYPAFDSNKKNYIHKLLYQSMVMQMDKIHYFISKAYVNNTNLNMYHQYLDKNTYFDFILTLVNIVIEQLNDSVDKLSNKMMLRKDINSNINDFVTNMNILSIILDNYEKSLMETTEVNTIKIKIQDAFLKVAEFNTLTFIDYYKQYNIKFYYNYSESKSFDDFLYKNIISDVIEVSILKIYKYESFIYIPVMNCTGMPMKFTMEYVDVNGKRTLIDLFILNTDYSTINMNSLDTYLNADVFNNYDCDNPTPKLTRLEDLLDIFRGKHIIVVRRENLS